MEKFREKLRQIFIYLFCKKKKVVEPEKPKSYKYKVVSLGQRNAHAHSDKEFADIIENKINELCIDGFKLQEVTISQFNEYFAFLIREV